MEQPVEPDKLYVAKRIVLQSLDTAALIAGAFIFYDLIKKYKKSHLMNNDYIVTALHILFIFLLDLILRSIFAYLYKIPI